MNNSRFSDGIWPAFVDMLSALVSVILFAFMIFMVAHFYLQGLVQNKDKNLTLLQKKILKTEQQLKACSTSLAAEKERFQNQATDHQQKIQSLQNLLSEKEMALRNQEALVAQDVEEKESLQRELIALKEKYAILSASQLKELKDYRSDFFGKIKKALGKRTDVRIVGDRFIFSSEVLFESGSEKLGKKGMEEMKAFAKILKEVMQNLPKDLPWILRVDGHTDRVPLKKSAKFSSNLELSAARAASVVQFLSEQGIPAHKLVVAAFGEHYPLMPGQSSSKDRRIELTLDQKMIQNDAVFMDSEPNLSSDAKSEKDTKDAELDMKLDAESSPPDPAANEKDEAAV
jgi:chemotaxis protein MotB